MKSDWYEKHWQEKETKEFNQWWELSYGGLEFVVKDEEEINEYFRRKGFALMGYLEGLKR